MENLIKNKTDEIYLISFGISTIITLIGSSSIISINNSMKLLGFGIAVLFICIKLFYDFKNSKFNYKKFIIFLFIGIYSLYATITLKKFFFIINYLLIIALKNVDIKKVIKLDITIKISYILFHTVTFVILTIINNSIGIDTITDLDNRIRTNLLLTHGNIAAGLVLWTVIEYYYLKILIKKLNIFDMISTSIIMLLIFYITKSRTSLILYFVFLIIILINRKYKLDKVIDILNKYCIEILAIIALGLTMCFIPYGIMGKINEKLSGRLFYSHYEYKQNGLNIFPNDNEDLLQNEIDSFYVRCGLQYGLIYLLIFAFPTKLIDSKKYAIVKIIYIIFAMNLFTEYQIAIIGNCSALLIIFDKAEKLERK